MSDVLPSDPKSRKDTPIYSGVLKYFPKAIAYLSHVSKVGNDQHNPGEPLHWAREKSTDHLDSCVRHLIDAGKVDSDGVRHSGKAAWRALANLETEIECAELGALRAYSANTMSSDGTSIRPDIEAIVGQIMVEAGARSGRAARIAKLGDGPLVIYVAGPYRNSDPSVVEYNINRADWMGRMLKKFGHHPIIPHTMTRSWDNRFTFEKIIESELQILARCDAILHFGSSEGADIELAEAERLGLRVFHKLGDVPNLTGAWLCADD